MIVSCIIVCWPNFRVLCKIHAGEPSQHLLVVTNRPLLNSSYYFNDPFYQNALPLHTKQQVPKPCFFLLSIYAAQCCHCLTAFFFDQLPADQIRQTRQAIKLVLLYLHLFRFPFAPCLSMRNNCFSYMIFPLCASLQFQRCRQPQNKRQSAKSLRIPGGF